MMSGSSVGGTEKTAANFTAGGIEILSMSREAGHAGLSSEIGAVFEAFVFEPEPSRWETSETDGRVGRPIERVRRSQDVEVGFIVLKGSTRAVKSEDQTPADPPRPQQTPLDHHCRHCPVPLRAFPSSRLFDAKHLSKMIIAVVVLSVLVYLIFFR